MMKKFNPILLAILIVALGASLWMTGAFDLEESTDETQAETVVAEESAKVAENLDSDVQDAVSEAATVAYSVPETEAATEPATVHVHKVASSTRENYLAPICTKEGGYNLVEYCTCGERISEQHIALEKTDHCYETTVKEPTCTKKGRTIYTCVECGESYTEKFGSAIGHSFESGACTICKEPDPNYSKEVTGAEIMNILSSSVTSSTAGYGTWTGGEELSVFAELYTNCFAFYTAVSYNLWGGNVQSVMFNAKELQNQMKDLYMSIGGETGDSGTATVEIFKDKSVDENEPDESYDIDLSCAPVRIKVKVKGLTSLGIRVTNHAGSENRIVFFDLSSKE